MSSDYSPRSGMCLVVLKRHIMRIRYANFMEIQSPTAVTRYSIPFFQAVKLELTLEELKKCTADIVAKIPASDDKKKRAVDVPSELISPLYACVSS